MPNNENYERDPATKLILLLNNLGWREVSQGVWEKDSLRLLVDAIGVFLFRWLRSKWVRTHGLAHTSMWRITHTREMIFADGAKLDLEDGKFTPGPKKKRRHQ